MANISLDLASLKFPNVTGFVRTFGTKKTSQQNGGSLTTGEFNVNTAMPFDKMRPVTITEDSAITIIEHDAKIVLDAESAIVVTVAAATFVGCRLLITNVSSVAHTVAGFSIKDYLVLYWNGTAWQNADTKIKTFYNVIANNWASNSTYSAFPYRCTINIANATAGDSADVRLPGTAAISGYYAPVSLTDNGHVYIYGTASHASSLTIPCIILTRLY